MAIDLKALLHETLADAATDWGKDLRAHKEDTLTVSPCETARSVADFAYETIYVNRRMANRLRGEPVPPMDGFPKCPPELQTADALAEAMRDSATQILDAVGDPEREIVRADGSKHSAFELANFAAIHMMYHLGQVNYIQTTYGDKEIHWMEL